MVLTALGPQFQRAKEWDRKEGEKGRVWERGGRKGEGGEERGKEGGRD